MVKTSSVAEPAAPQKDLFAAVAPLPEEIEQETHLVPRTTGLVGTTIAELALADPKRLDAYLLARGKAEETLRSMAIRQTVPSDWTLYKGRTDGKILGVLRDSGTVKVRRLMGISIYNHRPVIDGMAEPKITTEQLVRKDKEGNPETVPLYVAEMWADGRCALTGEEIEDVYVGLRSLDESGRQNFTGRGHIQDLKASCRTSLDSKVTRILSGIRKVDDATLTLHGITVEKCYLGSGFGTATSRDASGVSEAGLGDRQKALWAEILRRVGGDDAAAKDVLKDITFWEAGGKSGYARSVEQLTEGWKIEKAEKALKAHKVFGDAARGAAPKAGSREPGQDG